MIEEDFERALKSKERLFVLFYASWCQHSREFLPIFEEYASRNPDECMSVMIDDKPELCDKYSIEYYPTVLLFKKGKIDKRLDAEPGEGLKRKRFAQLAENP